jgi:hypothetical protein
MPLRGALALSWLAVLACHRETSGPARKMWFEAEIGGTLSGARADARRVLFVAVEPCDPDRIELTRTVAIAFLAPGSNGAFETEAAARDGSSFYVCAFAVDGEDRMVAFGQYDRNPVVVHAAARAEIEIGGVDVLLASREPRQLPRGQYR